MAHNDTVNLSVTEREHFKDLVWRMTKDGRSVHTIARSPEVQLDPKTVNNLLNEVYAEHAEIRKNSGVAEKDLIEYVEAMNDDRQRSLNLYRRGIERLEQEEALELIHEEARRAPTEEFPEGRPPTTAITRALEFHLRGVQALGKHLDSARAATEAKGRVLGLEAAGKEEAKLQLVAKRADLIEILNTPVNVTIKIAADVPENWDVPDSDDD